MTHSIGELARRHGLARSTLLYYDRIGLLTPSGRTDAGYRRYGDDDARRLDAICRYRAMGIALREIGELLDAGTTRTSEILEARLDQLNDEIADRRSQQRTILALLSEPGGVRSARSLDAARWVEILAASGLDDTAMRRWHVEFERAAPEAHQDFLEALGLDPADVRRIRREAEVDDPRGDRDP